MVFPSRNGSGGLMTLLGPDAPSLSVAADRGKNGQLEGTGSNWKQLEAGTKKYHEIPSLWLLAVSWICVSNSFQISIILYLSLSFLLPHIVLHICFCVVCPLWFHIYIYMRVYIYIYTQWTKTLEYRLSSSFKASFLLNFKIKWWWSKKWFRH